MSNINTAYARQYTPGYDVGLILKNYRYLGGQ
jgi:hypothetical protein